MYPVALVLSFALAVFATMGIMTEELHVRADQHQQALRYVQQLVPIAEQAMASKAATEVQNNQSLQNLLVSSPAPVCPVESQSINCGYVATYSGTYQGAGYSNTQSGPEASLNVNSVAGEERIAAAITITIYDRQNHVLVSREQQFTMRVYDAAPWATVVNSSDSAGQVTTDGDPAGCAGSGGNSTCGEDTTIQSYVGCDDTGAQAAPNPIAQGWENSACQSGVAPSPAPSTTPTTSWNYFSNSNYQNPNWTNGNTSSNGWSH